MQNPNTSPLSQHTARRVARILQGDNEPRQFPVGAGGTNAPVVLRQGVVQNNNTGHTGIILVNLGGTSGASEAVPVSMTGQDLPANGATVVVAVQGRSFYLVGALNTVAGGGSGITYSDTAPASPIAGDIWVTTAGLQSVYTGSTWIYTGHNLWGRVYRSAAFTTPTSNSLFGFDAVEHDPHSMWNNSGYYFLIPFAGRWSINTQIACSSATANDWLFSAVAQNGTQVRSVNSYVSSAGGQYLFSTINVFLVCAVNDQISLQYQSAAAMTGLAGTAYSWLTVKWDGPA